MATNLNDRNDPGYQDGFSEGMNHAYDNWGPQDDTRLRPDYTLPYEDPAVVNPTELATFPKMVKRDESHHHHHEHESHLVNRRTAPVREGRHITRTDNHPDKDGYM